MSARLLPCLLLAMFSLASATLPEARRIVFLGDSITHSGQYIEYIETVLLANTGKRCEILDLGLSSETVSGLSEDGHAGGKFPRPDLHERLERVLTLTKPDLILACYGMNCGIYLPLDETRFDKYKEGQRWLHDKAQAAGAQIVHLTPPVYDPVPVGGKFQYYNEVLDAYARWLMDQRGQGWQVIDIHTALKEALAEKRKTDPAFTFSKDGVHPNAAGHWIMAQAVLKAWDVKHDYIADDFANPKGRLSALHALAAKRLHLLSASYLSTAGHKRPGVKAGLPLDQARSEAAEITKQIDALKPEGAKPNSPAAGFPAKKGDWHGFDKYEFTVDGAQVTVVTPKIAAPGKPWCWHGEFFGHKPDPDITLLGKGFHIVYMKVPDMLGCPAAVEHWNAFYKVLTTEHGLNTKAALVGLSRGGLYCYNWAEANPDKVACIYGDAPVCDMKSWPGGKGKGKGDKANWQRVLKLWNFKSEDEAITAKVSPVDKLEPLAKAKVPLLHVYGDADDVVPPAENTLLLAERYRALGGSIELIAKPGVGHHPHGLPDSTPIVDFILKHAAK